MASELQHHKFLKGQLKPGPQNSEPQEQGIKRYRDLRRSHALNFFIYRGNGFLRHSPYIGFFNKFYAAEFHRLVVFADGLC